MTQIDDQAGMPAAAQQSEGLEVRVARELLERARAEGVSLVGPGELLAGLRCCRRRWMPKWLITWVMRGERPPFPTGNHRNGTSPKTVPTEVGGIPLEVLRDRSGKFDPQIVPGFPSNRGYSDLS